MLTGEQIKAARALARWEQTELAAQSGISVATIKRLEAIRGPIGANTATEAAIRAVFNQRGVIFLDPDGAGAGVRQREPSRWPPTEGR